MIQFLLYSTIIWVSFALVYFVIFREQTFFEYNRIYLIVGLLSGILLPFINHIPLFKLINVESLSTSFSVDLPTLIIRAENTFSINNSTDYFLYILVILYISGAMFYLFKLFKSLVVLNLFYRKSKKLNKRDYELILVNKPIIAFSFFNKIFINKNLINNENIDKILIHELVHVNQRHSYDIIFLEILKILFWFNPIIHIYGSLIKEIHEYIADNKAVENISKKSYGELLISYLQSGVQYNIANYFINSLIKNRIKMMYKKQSKNRWKYTLVFPLIILMIFIINACQTKTDENVDVLELSNNFTASNNIKVEENNDASDIFQVVEEMPRFPGCETETSKSEKELCANRKMYEYIYNNLKYPKTAAKEGVEGKVLVRFVVKSNGEIGDINIIKDIGEGCGEAVKTVLQNMNDLNEKWIPGKQQGKNVSVYFTLPIVFKLSDKK